MPTLVASPGSPPLGGGEGEAGDGGGGGGGVGAGTTKLVDAVPVDSPLALLTGTSPCPTVGVGLFTNQPAYF